MVTRALISPTRIWGSSNSQSSCSVSILVCEERRVRILITSPARSSRGVDQSRAAPNVEGKTRGCSQSLPVSIPIWQADMGDTSRRVKRARFISLLLANTSDSSSAASSSPRQHRTNGYISVAARRPGTLFASPLTFLFHGLYFLLRSPSQSLHHTRFCPNQQSCLLNLPFLLFSWPPSRPSSLRALDPAHALMSTSSSLADGTRTVSCQIESSGAMKPLADTLVPSPRPSRRTRLQRL